MMRIILVAAFIILSRHGTAQDFSKYQRAFYADGEGYLPYRILFPLSFDSSKSYPLIVFLHGANEKGIDNESQLNIGGRLFLSDSNRGNYPAFVIFPQCPLNDSWACFDTEIDLSTGLAKNWSFPFRKEPTVITALLKKLLDSLVAQHFIDRSRIYIGGLSQGAMGVYDIVARYPDLFAAAFPICGAGEVNTSKYFAGKVALWIFHGADDEIVPPSFSRNFYKRLK
ncbi:MAG TPA: PHB depolymerase family esterase, partial [Chitinophagaceae bacterium]|nr:PHB depolymerase family esterase [Chitinophagaceae bacterium]